MINFPTVYDNGAGAGFQPLAIQSIRLHCMMNDAISDDLGWHKVLRLLHFLNAFAQQLTIFQRKQSIVRFLSDTDIQPNLLCMQNGATACSSPLSCSTSTYITVNLINSSWEKRRGHIQGGQKAGHGLVIIILSKLNRLKKITGRFLGKFAVKWI